MEWITVTLSLYRNALVRGATLALRNWPVFLSMGAYAAILFAAGMFTPFLGIAGGFLFAIVFAACVGSFLYLVEMIVRTSKVSLADFGKSFGMYLWDWIGVSFFVSIFLMVAVPALSGLPQGGLILIFVQLAILIFLNAVPELIYLGHHSSLELIGESYKFISENWIEWFPINILLAGLLSLFYLGPYDGLLWWILQAGFYLCLYFAMVVRGLLFIDLHGTSRRGRAFRHKARQD